MYRNGKSGRRAAFAHPTRTPRLPAGHPGCILCIFMHVFMHIHAYSCVFMQIYACIYAYSFIFMHIYASFMHISCICIHIHAYFMHICVDLCICLIRGKYIYSQDEVMHHWTQFKLFINHYRNNQHIFRCCTGMTPWHGGGLGAVRL